MDSQKRTPSPSDFRHYRQNQSLWSQILHEVQYTMGLQQQLNQGRRSMESSLQDQHRIIRTNSYVLWTMQFASDISSNDERHPQR